MASSFRFGGASRVIAAFAVVGALVVVSIVAAQEVATLPAANTDYSVTVRDAVHPGTSNGHIAAIARHYLDEQTPELAAPGIHQPPRIISLTAALAQDAHDLEPGVPEMQVDVDPNRVVWIVRASGDFLNLHDLPWSSAGAPDPNGDLVIDDATGMLLGVYPHAP